MKMRAPFSTALAVLSGVFVLVGYFIEIPLLVEWRERLIHWAVIVAAAALLVGVLNLFAVHWRKAAGGDKGGLYSAVLILSLMITVVVAGYFGPAHAWTLWMYQYLQVPVESALMAVLAVSLALAAARLLPRRKTLFSVVFLLTAVFMLLSASPFFGVSIPGIHGPGGLRELLNALLVTGGTRGILIGVALGAVAAGLRLLSGADRPFGG
jgi:hypothetical protein